MNLNLKEFQESNRYIKSCQENKIEYFLDELYSKLKLHLILYIKLYFQENSQISSLLWYPCMNVIKFFSISHHVMMFLIMKNQSYHYLKCEP